MYHIFFILSSVDGHLGCFRVLAIVSSAAINIGLHVSFGIMVFSGYMPSIRLLAHMVVLFLVFKGTFILLSIVAVSIYIPTKSARGLPFLYTFSAFTVCRFLNNGHFNGHKVIDTSL